MKTITYEGVQHGDWVRCVLCGAQMLLPCGADKCPECGENGTLRWVDEDMNPYILFKTSKFGNIKVRFPKDEDMDAELLVLDQLFDVE